MQRTHLRRQVRRGPPPYALSSHPARRTRSLASSRAPSPRGSAGERGRSAGGARCSAGPPALAPALASDRPGAAPHQRLLNHVCEPWLLSS